MKMPKQQEIKPEPESIASIFCRHRIIEGNPHLALGDDGYIYIAPSLDSLIRNIREGKYMHKWHPKSCLHDTQRLDYLNMTCPSWEYGKKIGEEWFASAKGGSFKDVRDAIDSMMSKSPRVEVEVLPPEGVIKKLKE